MNLRQYIIDNFSELQKRGSLDVIDLDYMRGLTINFEDVTINDVLSDPPTKKYLSFTVEEKREDAVAVRAMSFKEIVALSGLSNRQFGFRYNIPEPTIKKWSTGERRPPAYVLELLQRVVEEDSRESQ